MVEAAGIFGLRGRGFYVASFFGAFRSLVEPAPRVHDPCRLIAINKNATMLGGIFVSMVGAAGIEAAF